MRSLLDSFRSSMNRVAAGTEVPASKGLYAYACAYAHINTYLPVPLTWLAGVVA